MERLGDRGRSCSAYAKSTKLYLDVVTQLPFLAADAAEAEKPYPRCREETADVQ
jgi:hypothetical protein